MQPPRDGQDKAFRFLDLPLEVRNAIYGVVLCSPPPPRLRRVDQGDLLPSPKGLCLVTHPQETQILRLNRQVHAEARDAMLRGNQLVRVRARGLGRVLESLMVEAQIPVVRTTALARASSRGFVMTHSIEWDGPGPYPPFLDVLRPCTGDADLVLLRRDLDAFCAMLAFRGFLAVRGFGAYAEHVLEVHNPFDDTPSPDFMGERNQRRLLGPYRDHMRGLARFSVRGHVAAEVARSVEAAVRAVPVPAPEQVVERLRRKKDLGNGYFRQRAFLRAAEAYASGVGEVMHLRNGPAWEAVRARGGDAFLRALAEAFYQVCLNAAQNILAATRDARDDGPDPAQAFAARAEAHATAAMDAGRRLETDWRPTLAQMAKASYRMAAVQRALGRMDMARAYIDTARQQAPGDPLIRREAEEIEGLVRSQAGLGRLLA